VPAVEQITTQSTSNKQMRTNERHTNALLAQHCIRLSCENSFAQYRRMVEEGIPRELARSVLPVGTYSHMFATVDLHNLAHFLKLRLHSHAQYEIRVYAEAILKLIEPIVPVAVAALKRHRLEGAV
jgi:thymidylate synthase (FAD)